MLSVHKNHATSMKIIRAKKYSILIHSVLTSKILSFIFGIIPK